MRTTGCLRGKLVILGWIVLAGALAGLAYVSFLASMGHFPFTWITARNGLVNGATITGLIGAFEIFFWISPLAVPIRRRSFPVRTAVKTLVYASIIVGTLTVYNTWLLSYDATQADAWGYVYDGLPQDTVFSILVALSIQFVMQMRLLIGGRVLTNVVLGRYNRPREEHRAFLFVDLADSTAIARRLGDIETHALISRVFFDLDRVIADHAGEVHRYVGDQVVVTWPLDDAVADGRCLRCALEMRRLLERRALWYRRRFGLAPAIRAGLHGGPVVAGECGDARVEIVYFGDTINTAARLEQAAKILDRWCLVSADLLDRMPPVPGWQREDLGPIPIKGRGVPLAVCALTPTDATGSAPDQAAAGSRAA